MPETGDKRQVEVACGDSRELKLLAGETVARARRECPELGIPIEARAMVNGAPLSRRDEAITVLREGDELCFIHRRIRPVLLLTVLLLALAITGGVFAYTYTTSSVTFTLTPAVADFAVVIDQSSRINWEPYGKYRGVVAPGNLFVVTPTTGYTGDLEVTVYLGNMDELSRNYSTLMMRLELVNASDVPVDAEGITQVLTLENGMARFYLPSSNITPGADYIVHLRGGVYIAYPFASGNWGTTYNPVLYCQVTQAG